MYPGKRILDLAIALPALLLSLPLQAATAIAIRATMGSPVIFKQPRPGMGGQPFTMYKFRTMRPTDVARGHVDDESRLTKLGQFLRSTSVDELPALFNVLRGDMSIVGPRPLLMGYLSLYSTTQARRMEVLPGLTGLAQINGRNSQTWEERFSFDVEYVDSCSLKLDLSIIARTALIVLRRDGITADGEATMPEFRGPAH